MEHDQPDCARELFARSEIEQTITERFEKIVRRYGECPAVLLDGVAIDYASLNRSANRIARAITAATPRGQQPVALIMHQSTDQIAAILGALKAGKIYVALDPMSHIQALRAMVIEAGIAAILTDDSCAEVGASLTGGGATHVQVNSIGVDVNAENPVSPVTADDAAYIFYTSGSTGAPKGVVDCHRNVLHNIMRYTNNLRIGNADRMTLLQACNFSGSVSSLFGALLNGAAVVPLDLRHSGIARVAQRMIDDEVTIYHSVPSIFEQLVRAGRRFPHLRVVRLEGDRCTRRHIELFRQHFTTGCTLANGLGATETGLTHQYLMTVDVVPGDNAVPVGYPAADIETVILDERGAQVTDGGIGEIAIDSAYLATGYWNNPALTAARFEATSRPGVRRYRTGDLGRVAADGRLLHLGRRDFQIRIRGQRVDVEALERAIAELPGVDQAVVHGLLHPLSGRQRLIAWFVPEPDSNAGGGGAPAGSETIMRQALAERVPAYMLPARFISIDSLPLGRHGKVNRNRLSLPDRSRPALGTPCVPPATSTEQALAEIWREHLDLESLGIDDDFFELGGDSMLAVSLPMLIEERLGRTLSDATLLEARTVRDMAKLIDESAAMRCLVCIQSRGDRQPIFVVHAHTGRVLEYRDLSDLLGRQQPFYALQPRGIDASATPLSTVEEMASLYLEEMRSLRPEGPYIIAGYCFGGLVAYEIGCQLAAQNQAGNRIILIDTEHPVAARSKRRSPRGFLSRLRCAAQRTWRHDPVAPEITAVQAANAVAQRRYKPGKFTGNVIHIAAEPRSADSDAAFTAWESCILGEFHRVRLPRRADGEQYGHLFHEPWLSRLADALADAVGEEIRAVRRPAPPAG